MNAIKSKMLVGTGLVALGLLSAVFAQGMMGQQGNTAQGQNAQGMMGGMMGGGMGMMNTYAASSRPISQDEARRRAEGFAARYGQGVKIRDFMVFTDNFYVQVVNAKTGTGLGELLVDRYTGVVQPEYGPNMMWNSRFGMGGSGMMGQQNQTGMMGDQNQQVQQGQGMMAAHRTRAIRLRNPCGTTWPRHKNLQRPSWQATCPTVRCSRVSLSPVITRSTTVAKRLRGCFR